MSKNSEAVKRWRRSTKRKIILAMGGKCICCGYNRCEEALEFHHVDPNKKEVSWGSLRANIRSLREILMEMKKCVLLCSNCHKEVHSKYIETTLPVGYVLVNDTLIDQIIQGNDNVIPKSPCKVCNKLKPDWQETCSKYCGYQLMSTRKIKWPENINMLEWFKTSSSDDIATQMNCSRSAVMVRLYKLYDVETVKSIVREKNFRKKQMVVNILEHKITPPILQRSHANSIKQRGSRNSQFGSCWINKEGKNFKIKKIEVDLYISKGYSKGRILA